MDFRIRQLQCFLTLSDLLNYNKTARALFMSQPAITFQIKSLEEAFGAKLFTRDRQQVRLTEAGVVFRDYAQAIMDTVHSAHERLSNLNTRLRLRVSCGPVGQFVLLPAVLRKLAADHPDFELEVQDLTTEQQMARLPEGKVDMLLMVAPLPIRDLAFDPIGEDPLVAVVSTRSPLSHQAAISVQDLRDEPIIATRLKDCRFHQPWLYSLFAPFGITPRVVDAAQSCTVQMAYAAAGEGVVIAAESMSLCMFPDVVAKPFREELPGIQLGMAAMQGDDSRAMAIFRSTVQECAAEIFGRAPKRRPRPIGISRPPAYAPVGHARQQVS